MNTKNNTRSLVTTALFAAVMCVSAYISIPLPAGHITLQNFVVLLIAFAFPLRESVSILAVWLLLGCAGVPVFIGGNAGISFLASGWGGYSASFIAVAALIPLLRGKEYRRAYDTFLAITANILVDIFGAAWLMIITEISVKQAFITGFLPFIFLDIVKAVVVVQILPQFRKIFQSTL